MIDDTREHFEADTKDHGLTILFDNGLYRHLRLAKPGTRIAQFDIVTWPGFLAFTGDMGDYVFARLDDMLEFFRGHAPNHSYWAEKCVAADKDSGIRAYDPAQARAAIEETVAEFLNDAWDLREDARSILQRDVEDHVLSCLDEGEHAANEALHGFVSQGSSRSPFEGAWEWDLKSYTHRFKWACWAIPWAIAKYDEAKAAAKAAKSATEVRMMMNQWECGVASGQWERK